MKEYILSEIRDTLFGKIPNEEIPTVIDSISFCLRNYDITERKHRLWSMITPIRRLLVNSS